MAAPVCISLSATHLRAARDGGESCQRPTTGKDAECFLAWVARYAGGTATWDERFRIGGELWRWLDGDTGWLTQCRNQAPDALWLEFSLDRGGDKNFVDVPWELLADDSGFLAEREALSFSVVRRFGAAQPPPAPSAYRPAVVFMAGDPRGNDVPLDYDGEEQAILHAVGAAGVDFLCEDTGNLEALAKRIRDETEGDAQDAQDAQVDIVHLSCHGGLADRPALALESEVGDLEMVGAQEIAEQFGDFRPRLLFLSGCTTAEADRLLGSLAGDLAGRGFPAVVGWGGKVRDLAATRFAAVLYQRLAARDSLESAVAQARKKLARHQDENVESEWHKARLFLGSQGGGRITQGSRRRHWHDADRADQEFLDKVNKTIPVASRHEFVGRRRPVQEVLRRLRAHQPTVIHGLGQHGKSSLANRIASRFPSHDPVVVFNDYTPAGILRAIRVVLANEGHDGAVKAQRIIDDEIGRLDGSPGAFAMVLGRLLKGPLRELHTEKGGVEQRPILMVVDDFERALEPTPGGLHRVKPELAPGIAALITAFANREHDSLLLFTSRFRFTCIVDGRDATGRLEFYQLPNMSDAELQRQTLQLARQKIADQLKSTPGLNPDQVNQRERALFDELVGVIRLAFGSPSLMSRIARLLAQSVDRFNVFKKAAQDYVTHGITNDQELLDFLEYVAIDQLLKLLAADERELLRRSTLFQIPVPVAVLALLHPRHHADAAAANAAVERLFALGLLNRFENPIDFRRGHDHALVDPLVRPKLEKEGPPQ